MNWFPFLLVCMIDLFSVILQLCPQSCFGYNWCPTKRARNSHEGLLCCWGGERGTTKNIIMFFHLAGAWLISYIIPSLNMASLLFKKLHWYYLVVYSNACLWLQNATQKSQKVFVHIPSEIAAHEVEEIGMSSWKTTYFPLRSVPFPFPILNSKTQLNLYMDCLTLNL